MTAGALSTLRELHLLTDDVTPHLYGAVSTGEIWKFGILERATKTVIQDLNLFRVPADLEELLRILIAILGTLSSI